MKVLQRESLSMLAYCDYIAQVLHEALSNNIQRTYGENPILEHVTQSKMDLHPQHGYMLSTSKFIEVRDVYNKKYRITIEEVKDGQ